MNIDKQIKEIKAISQEIQKTGLSEHLCDAIAVGVFDAGYRKTADVAEEIFAEIDDFQRTLRHIFLVMCGGNDYNTLNLLQIDSAIEALFDSRIAELKKKYTENCDGTNE